MNVDGPVPAEFDASGAFETCRVEKGKVLQLEEHLRRLKASLKTLGVSGWNEKEIRSELLRAARGTPVGAVRVTVQRRGSPRILIHRHAGVPYSVRQIHRGITVRTVPARWPAAETGLAQVKTSERLGSVLARAEGDGCTEVLRFGRHGYLTEGTVSNLFLVKGGTLMTPPGWLGVLEGVTRHRVLEGARCLRIPVETVPVTRHDLFNAGEAFFTNVLVGILPIREVDGRRIGSRIPGPVTRRLMRALSR